MTEEMLKICPKCRLRSVKFIDVANMTSEEKDIDATSHWYCVKCHTPYHIDENGKFVRIYKE